MLYLIDILMCNAINLKSLHMIFWLICDLDLSVRFEYHLFIGKQSLYCGIVELI